MRNWKTLELDMNMVQLFIHLVQRLGIFAIAFILSMRFEFEVVKKL